MAKSVVAWPHAPPHELSETGTFMVTAGTYMKAHHFRRKDRLDVLHRGLLSVARQFSWNLEAWAVFSNHYHFVGSCTRQACSAATLSQMLGILHTKTADWVNRLDNADGRKVWHNFWETRLTHHTSYLARLNYVHQNAVRHGLAVVANQYPWCSARWFERVASRAIVKSVYRFGTERIRLQDQYAPVVDP